MLALASLTFVFQTFGAPMNVSGPESAIRPFRIAVPQADLDDLADRLSRTRWPNEVADSRLGLRLPPGPPQGAGRALAYRLRLARTRGETQRASALHHRDRRAEHPLRPRPVPEAGRTRAGPHPRLARFVPRIPRCDRAAVARLPSGDPVHTGLRLLRTDPRARLGHRPDRGGVGRADAAARVRALRRAGRRLRLGHLDGARFGGARARGRGARQLPADQARSRQPAWSCPRPTRPVWTW